MKATDQKEQSSPGVLWEAAVEHSRPPACRHHTTVSSISCTVLIRRLLCKGVTGAKLHPSGTRGTEA
ncbi:hypothetical protein GJAV_G00146930 [Gymnothorax javanicus]|nr:hypothetical protein GJAV_G00146930 [Gymnothorax javanicus]